MVISAVIVLGGLGIIFGIGLAISSKIFHVDVDPKIEKIEEVLPGANCRSLRICRLCSVCRGNC